MNNKAKNLDAFRYLRKQTLQRSINGVLVLISYYLSKWRGKAYVWGNPIAFSLEPTTSCNLRCPECPSGLRSFSRDTGMVQKEMYQKVIDAMYKKSSYLILYFQGEPFLHKQIFDIIGYAQQKKLYVATSTNGHYLTDENACKTVESGIDRLIISIDGTTQETYQQYRVGGQLDKVLQGTKNIIAWKKKLKSATPHVIFQYLVVKPNEHQIDNVMLLANDLGVDEVVFKTAQVYNYEDGNELIPDNQKYSRYIKQSNGKYKIKNELLNQCWRMWHTCVFTWDGYIVPCCFDKDALHKMGNISTNLFKDIWHNELYNSFRNKLLKSRNEIDICKNCTEGTKVD